MTMPMITIDGGTLSYDVSGAGPPIVFVAGLGEHGTYWMAQVAAFSSAFQVVTFDHGGVGASEGQPPYKVEQWAADTLRLIDHLGLDRVHLVGHSTGGAIAQVLAADHSDRVASLVLGATWARLELSELIAEEIAHARLVKLDHRGHHFPRTQVEAYNALLLEFFRAHAERDAPGAG
jgi:pimeloyl-ACP methyl ester carboxylesterase